MGDDSMDIVQRLPDRPLTTEEGDTLGALETESAWVRPEAVVVLEEREVVVALAAVDRERGTMHLLGYSPDAGDWVVVDEWDEADLEHDAFYERLQAWETETFGDQPEYHLG